MLLTFLLGAAAVMFAQSDRMSPYQGESDGVSAGGNWLEFHSTDPMTGAKKVRFELQSNNYFREDPNYKPRVNLYCDNGNSNWGTLILESDSLRQTALASGDNPSWRCRFESTTCTISKAGTGCAATFSPWTKARFAA